MNTTIKMSEQPAKDQANAETAKVLSEIREFIERHKLNKSHIANAVGLRPQHINRMTSGQHVPKLDSLLLLIKGVELVFGETFEPVGFVKIRSKLVAKSK